MVEKAWCGQNIDKIVWYNSPSMNYPKQDDSLGIK